MCKNKKVRTTDSNTDDDSYRVSPVNSSKKCRSHVTVTVDNHPVHFQVDLGADVNIIDEKTFSH